jgi:hypothetical protein
MTILLKDDWLDLDTGSVRFHAAIGDRLVGGEVTQTDMLRWFGVEGEDQLIAGFRANWPQISTNLAARLTEELETGGPDSRGPDQANFPAIVSIDGMDPTAARIAGVARDLIER